MSLPARDPVAGFFDFGEKGGIAAPSTDVFAPFTGYSMGPGQRGATLPLGTSVGDATSTYRKGNMFGFDQDNGAIVRQYVSSHKSIAALKEDTGVGHILYSCNPRMKKYALAKEAGRARKEEPRFSGVKEPLEFKSLSRLNAWLKSKEGRAMFGKDRDCARFRSMFRLAGGQVTKAHDSLQANDEFVLAIATGRRFRGKDFTLMNGKGAQMNDVVFIVWRRHRFEGVPLPPAIKPGAKKSPPLAEVMRRQREQVLARMEEGGDDEDVDMGGDEKEKEQEKKEKEAAKKGPSILKKAVQEPGIAADKKEDEYYWRGDYWYGPRGTEPNTALYLPDSGSFIGDIDFLGLVIELYGDRSNKLVNQANAKEALYNAAGSDDWKKAFVELPDIEIHLNIR